MFTVLVDHINASRAAAAFGGDNDADTLTHLADILDGPSEQTAVDRRAQIAAASFALGGD